MSTHSLTVQDRRSASLESMPEASPMKELQMQIVRTGDLEKLKQLREIEKEWREDQAKHAFIEAMACFKAEPIYIRKDRENVQYSKGAHKAMYVSLGNLVQTVTPYLSKHGLSVTWADPVFGANDVKVICRVSHAAGHFEEVSFVCPFDTSGAKNPIQSRKSAITYGRAITYEMALGLAATDEANVDDDGNGCSSQELSQEDEAKLQEWADALRQCGDLPTLKHVFADAYKFAAIVGDQHKSKMTRVYNECKAGLQ